MPSRFKFATQAADARLGTVKDLAGTLYGCFGPTVEVCEELLKILLVGWFASCLATEEIVKCLCLLLGNFLSLNSVFFLGSFVSNFLRFDLTIYEVLLFLRKLLA